MGKVAEYFEKNEFPPFWNEKIKEFGIMKHFISTPYGNATTLFSAGVMIMELARCEPSLAFFFLASNLSIASFEFFAS